MKKRVLNNFKRKYLKVFSCVYFETPFRCDLVDILLFLLLFDTFFAAAVVGGAAILNS